MASTQDERIKTASKNRRERQKAETRQAILDAASELFLEKGYENFSLRQVAEQIGYSPGTIYLYFSDRDALLFTLADEGFQRFGRMLQATVESSDNPREQLIAMGEGYVDFGLNNPVHYRLMFLERPDFMMRERPDSDEPDTWADTFMILHRCVERAMEQDVIEKDDPRTVSDAIWAMLHGVVALGIRMPHVDDDRTQQAADKIRRVMNRGLFL
ncbi:MAG: TetR/AcrR family transcriptional regulator [Chloroflexota bacterium]